MESLRDTTRAASLSVASVFMRHVYQWMTVGLLVTAATAFFVASSPAILSMLFGNTISLVILAIAVFAMPLVLMGAISRLSSFAATSIFIVYSALMGAFLSSVLIVYTGTSVMSTFITCAAMFGGMSLYGYTTKRDLSGFGNMLFMALIGIVLASLVNFWLKSEALMWAVTYIGVIVFVGLTAYDTQKLKNIGEQIDLRDSSNLRKYAILGALTLYLDFINLFLMLLRIFGNRR